MNPQLAAGGLQLQPAGSTQRAAGASYVQPAAGALRLQPAAAPPATGKLSLPGQSQVAANQASVDAAKNSFNAQTAQINALLAQIAKQNQQVYAPSLNLSSISAQARQQAEGAVNPYYVKQLNDFLAQQAVKRQQQEQQTATNIKNLEEQLANTLEGNQIAGQRTAQDVSQNQANINTQGDQYQTDTGQQFATDRLAQARQLAQSGLTGGIGAQQTEATQQARNTTEKRQEEQFQQARDAQELFKSRTFEDIARSGEQAQKSTEKGKKQAQFDLDSYIQNQGFETEQRKSSLEAERLGAVSREQSNRAKLLVNNFINSIANPAQRQAAIQAYGGIF